MMPKPFFGGGGREIGRGQESSGLTMAEDGETGQEEGGKEKEEEEDVDETIYSSIRRRTNGIVCAERRDEKTGI
jgi:hypothetical protein